VGIFLVIGRKKGKWRAREGGGKASIGSPCYFKQKRNGLDTWFVESYSTMDHVKRKEPRRNDEEN